MQYNVKIDEALLKKHKIKDDEFEKIKNLLGREPNLVEIGVFSAMWSEHCSYKTTKIHLQKMHHSTSLRQPAKATTLLAVILQ